MEIKTGNQKRKAYIWIPMDGQPAFKLEISRKELARILRIRRAGRQLKRSVA